MPFPKDTVELAIAGYKFSDDGHCRACGARIQWWITPKNRKMPLDAETLIPHWGTCPNTADFKRPKK